MVRNIYPKLDMRRKDSNYLILSSWVRVKRNGLWYEVFVLDKYICEYPYMEAVNAFNERCMTTKHLWILPSKCVIEMMIKEETLRLSKTQLTNKELFLLNLNKF